MRFYSCLRIIVMGYGLFGYTRELLLLAFRRDVKTKCYRRINILMKYVFFFVAELRLG